MSQDAAFTPCPMLASHRELLLDLPIEQTTTNLDFTSAFHATLRDNKPRRGQILAKTTAQFTIHEDGGFDDGREASNSGLAKPARRQKQSHMVRRSLTGVAQEVDSSIDTSRVKSNTIRRTSMLAQGPMRMARSSFVPPVILQEERQLEQSQVSPKRSKPTRRATLYIPSENTTMPSMYMGIFSPIKHTETEAQGGENSTVEFTGIAAQMAERRTSRKSILQGVPKRGVLQVTARMIQETSRVEDRFGQGDGKENVPPGHEQKPQNEQGKGARTTVSAKPFFKHSIRGQNCRVTGNGPLTAAKVLTTRTPKGVFLTDGPANIPRQTKSIWNGGPARRSNQLSASQSVQRLPNKSTSVNHKSLLNEPQKSTRSATSTFQPTLIEHHVLLSDDIKNPLLFEEDWLFHQEVAITQIINQLFSTSTCSLVVEEDFSLTRKQLLKRYDCSQMSVLHERIQAALNHGILSIPRDVLDSASGLHADLGRRKCFTDLWIESYDSRALSIAVEVVIGRTANLEGHTSTLIGTESSSKTPLRRYLEAFLIQNQDCHPRRGCSNVSLWSYQHTFLRSLMLIKVLDILKQDQQTLPTSSLFLTTSPHKSSAAVVRALAKMLNPAIGDAIRALKLLGYEVFHEQQPLQEFDYTMTNIATDLRDGIRLARLVELLLYPCATKKPDGRHESDVTTIVMPEGENVEIHDWQEWPLSRHLKFPCLGRTTKIWNAHIALGALSSMRGMANLIYDITPSDIVDGYREKTIRLLWGLVGKQALPGLIDWTDVRSELRRLEHHPQDHNDWVEDLEDNALDSLEECKALLRTWSKVVANAHGVRVHNFTTSFADGTAFEAIVDEYEPYLLPETDRKRLTLEDRLARLGCNAQFTQLFSPRTGDLRRVFDQDFVFATLAFLCSRLLPPTRNARAATTIQRGWRRYWGRVVTQRKVDKATVARACADACRARNDLVNRQEMEMAKRVSLIESPSVHDIWLSL